MVQELPSDKLKKPRRPWLTAGVIAVTAFAFVGAGAGAYALTNQAPPIPRSVYAIPVNLDPLPVIDVSKKHLKITVDGAGSTDPDGQIVTYLWDFGDGTTSEEVAGTHTYKKPGEYTITLTVTDDGSRPADATASRTFTAKKKPPPPPPPPPPPSASTPGYSYGQYPPGATVPFLPGTNAPDTSACASSSASTVGGVAVCD